MEESALQTVPGVEVRLTEKEYSVLQKLCAANAPKPKQLWIYKMLYACFYGSIAMLTLVTPWAFLPLVASLALSSATKIVRRPTSEVLDSFSGKMTIVKEGLNRWSAQRTTTFFWAGITEIRQTSESVLVQSDLTALLIPFRCFRDDDHRHDFLQALQAGMRNRL